MDNLKALLGEAFKEDLTLADVNKLLEGKKLVDLSGPVKYVVKDKFDRLTEELATLKESTKGFDEVSKELTALKTEKENAVIKQTLLSAGVDEKFIEDISFRIEKGVIAKGDKFVDNVKEFLKTNPHYATTTAPKQATPTPTTQPTPPVASSEQTPIVKRIFSTTSGGVNTTEQPVQNNNASINDAIRNIVSGGKK
jgi:hypothetical protein